MKVAHKLIIALLVAVAGICTPALSEEVCSIVSGAVLIAQDDENTYLGKITASTDSDSIFNKYGTFGSEYSSTSIWNKFSQFGSEFSSHSPFNKFTSTPPMMVKGGKIIGYLSANKTMNSSITPNLLRALCEDDL
jgi:hypothetical protein